MMYIVTKGQYSDYDIVGLYEGPENIDIKALFAEYGEEVADSEEFHRWVHEKVGLKEITYREFWEGEYSIVRKDDIEWVHTKLNQ